MPKYRLVNLDARGFAEMARMLFAQAGVDYEDVRLGEEEWSQYKPNAVFQQLPVLQFDGVELSDSLAITRYLARQFGMAGKTPLEEAQVDMYAAAAYDLIRSCASVLKALDEEKETLKKKFVEETAPKFLGRFEKTLLENDSGFLIGNEVTWADVTLAHFMYWVTMVLPAEVMAKYPRVQEHKIKVESLPKIAEWIEKRPVTES